MSDCTLQKTSRYPLSEIVRDDQAGAFIVTVNNLTVADNCPAHKLTSHSATVQEIGGTMSFLTYSEALNHPVILKSNNMPILHINGDLVGRTNLSPVAGTTLATPVAPTESEGHPFLIGGGLLLLGVLIYSIYRAAAKASDEVRESELETRRLNLSSGTVLSSSYGSHGSYRSPAVNTSSTTVINNTNSGNDLLTGVLVGEALANSSSRPSRRSRDDDDTQPSRSSSSGSHSSDSSSSYNSDSGSSYSSDSSSSYSSDSSSSYSSDSGSSSSFGND